MLKRFILWDYPRGGWRYDVIVGLIVAFIFLTPRSLFHDQPRIPNARRIAPSLFLIDKEHLSASDESERVAKATEVLRALTNDKRLEVKEVEVIRGSENDVQGYLAVTKP